MDLSRWLFRDVYSVVGRNLRFFLCGGAALDPDLIAFFRRLGITVLQGYGITVCSPIVAANVPHANRFGSIGRTFPCCETRLIDGEICVRGESVSPGYYKDEAAVWWEVDRVNRTLAPHEQIGGIVLRSEPFEKTVMQKIKRYA